jgi:hypothetical protein
VNKGGGWWQGQIPIILISSSRVWVQGFEMFNLDSYIYTQLNTHQIPTFKSNTHPTVI